MIIKNGEVFQEDGSFQVKDIYVENHKIVASQEEVTDKTVVDAEGLLVLPGLVDIHSHGAYGHDFSDADGEGLKKILKYERSCGITSYCPTSMTLPEAELEKIFATLKEAAGTEGGAVIRGINMEGPFLDPKKKGAHVEEYIRKPSAEFFRRLNTSCGNMVKLVTLAPNVEEAMEFIDEVHDEVCISLGHTGADYETASEAMKRGAHHVTHLYNAMMPLAHRDPGLIGAASDDPECMVELICDGLHIHPCVVRATFRIFGSERVILISDSMMATGMANGTYQLGGQEVTVKDRKATLSDGTIAGSATNLYDCMRKAVSFGIPLAQAVFAATRNPAKSIGIYDRVGSLSAGKEADILLTTKELELKQVI
ncbi:MAG: N-acetylglucosamine-6-phosphate deacetylase [Eubacteriales bacterium]|nr:N-acetylglucosamine-6-phosphate deacetylase [Eubacteriales bacterium]